jgi:nuclease S1
MKRKNASKFIASTLIALLLGLNLPSRAFGWGGDGHKIVARMAAKMLTTKARTQVTALLAQGETLESIALWADGLRGNFNAPGARPETPQWHFVDIPRGENYDESDDCVETPNGSCVVSALVIFQAVLSKKKEGYYNEKFNRYEALKFIVHFVGDIHQPLHCINDNDIGGNRKKVRWLNLGERNLHGVWDSDILTKNMQTANKPTAALYADFLFQSLTQNEKNMAQPPASNTPTTVSRSNIENWADAAHDIAEQAYDDLPAIGSDDRYTLTITYYNAHDQDVDNQLKLAAIRLARILNENLR